jgi:ssDNA thymidine ADP-ribosyltransferase, DarT/HD domain
MGATLPMSVPPIHAERFLYHFTHIDNMASILEHGFLANNEDAFPTHAHISIAEKTIQDRRAMMRVPCGPGGVVHDYVPLYFGSLSLMLLGVINKKNVDQCDILYFEFPISLLRRDDVVFTDASANTNEPPKFFQDPRELAKLNWAEIDSRKWRCENDELRHQRMAEVLVHKVLRPEEARRVVVWNQATKDKVQKLVEQTGVPFPELTFEVFDRPHYFTNFMAGKPDESLVIGPRWTKKAYVEACQQVRQAGLPASAPYRNLRMLLDAIRGSFGCLQETAELLGLNSANGMHKRTVDIHTKEVVAKLRTLSRFQALASDADRDIVELAAYLHDIGKGPKSRWDDGVQKVDANHPVAAMPMMVNILTTQIDTVPTEEAELLLKLVCYHDLIGEVLGKGRDEHQIVEVAQTQRDLDMLFALGQADSTVLVETWWNEIQASLLYERCLNAIKDCGNR